MIVNLSDVEWWESAKRLRTLDYFVVLTIVHDLSKRDGVGFFRHQELIDEAVRRVRWPRKILKKGTENGKA